MPFVNVPLGTTHGCIGPVPIPSCARSVTAFRPHIDERIVHHIAVYGSTDRSLNTEVGSTVLRNTSFKCYGQDRHLLYIWARAGKAGMKVREQKAAEFRLPESTGYFSGGKGELAWLYFNIHYENPPPGLLLEDPDTSSVDVELQTLPPRWPLSVFQLACNKVSIPPGQSAYRLSCPAARVLRGGTVVFHRNHAHQAGGLIWSDIRRNGAHFGRLGERSAQEPQLLTPVTDTTLEAGDELTLTCEYDTRDRVLVTPFGFQEDREEMCLQFLVANASTSFSDSKKAAGDKSLQMSPTSKKSPHGRLLTRAQQYQ